MELSDDRKGSVAITPTKIILSTYNSFMERREGEGKSVLQRGLIDAKV